MSRILAGGRMGIGLAAAAALMAAGAGAERMPIFHSPSVLAPSPAHAVESVVRRRLSRKQIEERNRHARRRRAAARRMGHPTIEHPSEFQRLVNRMTNWERCQWAKAGYPGLQSKDDLMLRQFCDAHFGWARKAA
jgi:hypothetical protein